MKQIVREVSLTALALVLFSIVGAAALAATYVLTRPNIEASERHEKLLLLTQVLPPNSFDNDLVREARAVPATPLLGTRRPGELFVARKGNQAAAVVVEAIAPDGYSGEIRLLVGVLADGRISGVRVTDHHETPGLGDYIDIKKNNWILQFDGKTAQHPDAEHWRVRKDGGQFEYLVGATVTPRAVVKAVHKALVWFEQHRDELFAEQQP